jgi:catechol 2,3-dioxygenase-like lactoylglutathione lyase family enzyme
VNETPPGAGVQPVGRFGASAVTHMLVVADAAASRDWYVDVLDASVHGEYGGTSVVLDLLGTWLLLVTGGAPTPDKPTVTLGVPDDPDRVSAQLIFRVEDCWRTFELLSGRGAEFLTAPVDRGGEIRAFFRDPDGHLFEISQLS